jgi:alpha-1,3-rhamnosyl/mannosyltransferase
MLIGRFSGVARFVTGLIDALAERPELRIIALYGNEPFPPWTSRNDIEVIPSGFARADRSPMRRLWWEETSLARMIRGARADLFHATWNSGIPRKCPVPSVLTVHDVIPWHDTSAPPLQRWQACCYRYGVRAAVRRAAVVTTVSEFVRRELLRTLGCSREVVTLHNGIRLRQDEELSADGQASSTPYGLYVGGHEPRKNLAAVFSALERFWARFSPNLDLHLTGTLGALDSNARLAYDRLAHPKRVHFLGQPIDACLQREYANAAFLLFLSKAEGFGLPIVEAFAAGCPVIAADETSLPEVVGDAGILVNSSRPDDVVDAMHRLLSRPELRGEYVDRGKRRAADFNWKLLSGRWLEVYQRAAGPFSNTRESVDTTGAAASFGTVTNDHRPIHA